MEPDYKSMYLHMVKATDIAIRTLIEAQQFCEDLYQNPKDPGNITDTLESFQLDPFAIELS